MNDWFVIKMAFQWKGTRPQVVGLEPLDHGLLQQLPLHLHASHGISQQQTFINHEEKQFKTRQVQS